MDLSLKKKKGLGLTFFLNGDPPPGLDKKHFGRKAEREERKKRDDTECANANNKKADDERGMSVGEQIKIAALELEVGRYETDRQESKMMSLRLHADILERKIERATERAKVTGNFDSVDELESQLDALLADMKESRTVNDTFNAARCKRLIFDDSASENKKQKTLVENTGVVTLGENSSVNGAVDRAIDSDESSSN